jgi:hypothetical protein
MRTPDRRKLRGSSAFDLIFWRIECSMENGIAELELRFFFWSPLWLICPGGLDDDDQFDGKV